MLTLLALVLFETPLAYTQPSMDAVSGRVLDADLDDYGVPGVTIRVEGMALFTVTNDDGTFTMTVPTGAVWLLVDAPEYQSARVELSVESRARPLEIALTWAGESEFSVAAVAARLRPETASTTYLTPRDITAAPRRNAEEVLRQVPGLALVQHGSEGKGHQFFMRGFDAVHGADLELSVDGIPLNEWSNIHAQGYLDLALIIPEMIRDVSVTKGPFTPDQGAFGMAGSADYRLGVPVADRGLRAAYTAGTTNRHRVFAGYAPMDQGDQQFVGLEATHDDGFGQNRAIQRATFNGRVRLLDLKKHGTLHLVGLGGYSAFELPGTLRNDEVEAGLVDFYDAYDPATKGASARGLLSLVFDAENDGHRFSLTGYGGFRRLDLLENFTGFLLDAQAGDRREQFHQAWSFGLVGKHEVPIMDQLALRTELGLRGDVFYQHENNVGRELELIAEQRDLEGLQLIAHLFSGVRWSPAKQIRIDAGVRVDFIHVDVSDRLDGNTRGEGSLGVASPRVSARLSPFERWKFFGAYGRGYRPPEARAFSSFEPARTGIGEELFTGDGPEATVSDAVEIGTRWDPSSWFGLSLSGFGTFIERESVFDHVSGVSLELNGTRRVGGELVLYSNPLNWLTLSADLTLVDARFVESGNQVPHAPWLVSGLRAVMTHESGLRAGFRVLTIAPRALPHGAKGATLVMTDMTLGYHWRWLRLDLEVENVFNQQLREGEYHYASHWRPGEPSSEIPGLHTTAGPPFNARLTVGVVF